MWTTSCIGVGLLVFIAITSIAVVVLIYTEVLNPDNPKLILGIAFFGVFVGLGLALGFKRNCRESLDEQEERETTRQYNRAMRQANNPTLVMGDVN